MCINSCPAIYESVTDLKAKEVRRFLAVQRVLEGETQVAVAASLKVSLRSVSKWMSLYRSHGVNSLKAQPHPGAPSKLSEEQENQVVAWLNGPTKDHGYDSALWTSPMICEVIKDRFQIAYNPEYFCRWLRKRDFTPQIPTFVASQRDEKVIAAYPTGPFQEALKKGRPTMPRWF
jgi:transposase